MCFNPAGKTRNRALANLVGGNDWGGVGTLHSISHLLKCKDHFDGCACRPYSTGKMFQEIGELILHGGYCWKL